MDCRHLYYFNADHDLALANNDSNYMSPESARGLSNDLAILPMWFADKNDLVIAASGYNKRFTDEMRTVFPDLPYLITEKEVSGNNFIPAPWGWNPAIRKKFREMGIREEYLPDHQQLSRIRDYSHRKWSMEILSSLRKDNPLYCGEAYYLTEIAQLKDFVEAHERCVLKMPISGSGKGLNWCRGQFTKRVENWCVNVLEKQKAILAEPFYQKMIDFSMQFYVDYSDEITFLGYSIFETTSSGAYVGNVLSSNECIQEISLSFVSPELLVHTRKELEKLLHQKLDGSYRGYLGVDMMICRFPEKPFYRVHPCVEVNLRMNMGMVSRLFFEKYVSSNNVGRFYLEYFSSNNELTQNHRELIEMYPLRIDNGKLKSGYMSLVPVNPHSKYACWVII